MKPAERTTEPTSAAAIMFVLISGAYTNCTKGPTSAAIAEMTSTRRRLSPRLSWMRPYPNMRMSVASELIE